MSEHTRTAAPRPSGPRISGNVIDIRSDPVGFLRECRDRYGDVFRYSTHVVVTSDPDDIHTVLTGTDRTPGPAAHDDSEEREIERIRARTLARRALKPAVMAQHIPQVAAAVNAQLHEMSGRDIDPADLAPFFVRAVLPATARDPHPDLVPAVVEASRAAIASLDPGKRVPRWLPSRHRRRIRNAEQLVRHELRAYLAHHRMPPPGCPHAVADDVLEPGERARGPIAERALATTLLASAELPSTALAWVLYELGTRERERDALRAEARDLTAAVARLARGHELADVLPRTRAFVHEVLRLHPPAWLMARRMPAAARLGEHHVAPGDSVVFSPYLVHRDPRWWQAPDEFRPQRWLAEHPPHAPRAYLPFGAGPRICYGAHLGTAVLCLTVARIVAEYRLRLPGASRVEPRFAVPLRPANLRMRWERAPVDAPG
ncbi:cytochrome P450 [Saccharopolyspora sp. HNM0983]|uniref:Cytochrome P450 n=1 Tax=Saccharopolyspora montiporae TaxID=2781240 RepID=A0A929BFR1_9PSEU|nr:cytochrome P450 [Saccharopolyspora sp. HNM0983]